MLADTIGASFTAVISMSKLLSTDRLPSLAVTITLVLPFSFGFGVMLNLYPSMLTSTILSSTTASV